MYDALLQMLYIVQDCPTVADRATDYLEFGAVEHCRFMECVIKGNCPLSERIACSPLRSNVETAIRNEYERVKSRFESERGHTRQHWYPGNLWDLAKAVGKGEEYKWLVTFSNSSVHAGAFAVIKGPLGPTGDESVIVAAGIACQAAEVLVEKLNLDIGERSQGVISHFSQDFCSWKPEE